METDKEKPTVMADLLAVAEAEINLTQAVMLMLFDEGMKSTDVRKLLDSDRVLMSINIKKMRDTGLIKTSADPDDRRFIKVTLTKSGLELVDRIRGNSPSPADQC